MMSVCVFLMDIYLFVWVYAGVSDVPDDFIFNVEQNGLCCTGHADSFSLNFQGCRPPHPVSSPPVVEFK